MSAGDQGEPDVPTGFPVGTFDAMATEMFGERYGAPLAAALGIVPSNVTKWRTGHPIPGPVVACMLAWHEIWREKGLRPPVSPGSDERFDPRTQSRRGRRPRYIALLD